MRFNLMWFNLIGFNLSWLGLVIYGDKFSVFAILWLLSHLYLTTQKVIEVKLITLITSVGLIIDTCLLHIGIFTFDTFYIIPFWLIVLWACFAATIRCSLSFLENSKRLQLLCGLIFPPLSYITGASLSAVTLNHSIVTTYALLAAIWGPLMLIIYSLKAKLIHLEVSDA